MSNRSKNIVYSLVLIAAVAAVWYYRNRVKPQPLFMEGKTMGTTYHITYFDAQKRNFKPSVDSILALVNKSISTWDSISEISQFNRGGRSLKFGLPYFLPPLQKSKEVAAASQGWFDPTVMPLVNAWGFGPQKRPMPDSLEIKQLMPFVGFEKISFNADSVWKSDSRTQLDFSGIGQGYGADVIANYLKSKGIANMLVEVGGEGMAVGLNAASGEPWQLGVVNPEQPSAFLGYVKLKDQSFSTSGNYFNYHEVNGQKYSHTINPVTGFTAERAILSASVFTNDCTTADAWATACMAMGHEKAIELVQNNPALGVILIYSTPVGTKTFVSGNMQAAFTVEAP